ncbi:primosomal protein DnaT [Pantoea sp. Mhis]|uniref:primosomal protein DnaT n=1 Tax=Pantoea sp. Mhis TaxID=2576759 RepID=UPI0013591E00|nr:primosomal protein DnaT [Pantoea sp. Mhis]MXP56704.1 primosomal protein DnaT [Pantoea sp. Mhis]
MPTKLLTSTLVGMDVFCQDPFSAMLHTDNGMLAVLHHNIPIFYALTPERLSRIIALETSMQTTNNISTYKNKLNSDNKSIFTPLGKFTMYQGWKPDKDFQRQAAIWGIVLHDPVTPTELATFITYWQAEGCLFHHVQWQQKLARSVQMYRIANNAQIKRNITQINHFNYDIPDGFRGE